MEIHNISSGLFLDEALLFDDGRSPEAHVSELQIPY